MATKIITIPGLGLVQLYKRRGVRSLRLSLQPDGSIRVSLPYWLPYIAATEFALSKKDWILAKRVVSVPLKQGSRIGKAHRISFIADPSRQTAASRITRLGEIRIHHPAQLPASHPDIQKTAEKAAHRALKSQAQKLLPQRLQTLSQQHGFSYKSVTIKRLKTRWGSCSAERHIALNCYLMQLPWHLIDYVILHELLHTQIMAHGPVFWTELEKYLPNVKELRKEIRNYQPALIPLD